MVNLSNVASARLSQSYCKTATDIIGRQGFGRKNIQDKDVPYIERTPLALKNTVSLRSTKTGQKACWDEMMEVISCLSKFDQNESMCKKEITSFNSCYKTFQVKNKKQQKLKESGNLAVGQFAKFTGKEMNDYMKKFPFNDRKGEFLPESAYKKKKSAS